MVQNAFQYLEPSRRSSWVWQTDGQTEPPYSGASTRHKIGHVGNERPLFCVKQALFSWRPCVCACVSVCLSVSEAQPRLRNWGCPLSFPYFLSLPSLPPSLPPFFFLPGYFLPLDFPLSIILPTPFIPYPPLIFSGVPPLEGAEGSAEGSTKGSAERYELLSRFGQSPAAINSFGTFISEVKNKPLVSGDNDVEEVYRRRTSFSSHKVDENFGCRTPHLEILGVSGHPRHPQWLRHWSVRTKT